MNIHSIDDLTLLESHIVIIKIILPRFQVKILVNVTEDTDKVTLHAVDMSIDESFTNIKLYSAVKSGEKVVKILEQRNDTERQFYVIRTSDTLKKGAQYIVNLKFVGHLNDYLQGFYRSSYTVGSETR